MPSMDTFTMVNTRYLEWLNTRSRMRKAERTLSRPFLSKVDRDGLHIVVNNFLVDPGTVRCTVLVKVKDRLQPAHATLDLSYDDYCELPRFTYDEHGDVIVAPASLSGSVPARRYRNIAHRWARAVNKLPAPRAEDALTFDEVEAAGLDGTLRTVWDDHI